MMNEVQVANLIETFNYHCIIESDVIVYEFHSIKIA